MSKKLILKIKPSCMGHRVWYLCVHIFVWYVPKEFPSHFVNHKRMFTFCAEVICSINDTFMTMISFFWHSLSCVHCDVTITNILMLHKFDITREAPCEKYMESMIYGKSRRAFNSTYDLVYSWCYTHVEYKK